MVFAEQKGQVPRGDVAKIFPADLINDHTMGGVIG